MKNTRRILNVLLSVGLAVVATGYIGPAIYRSMVSFWSSPWLGPSQGQELAARILSAFPGAVAAGFLSALLTGSVGLAVACFALAPSLLVLGGLVFSMSAPGINNSWPAAFAAWTSPIVFGWAGAAALRCPWRRVISACLGFCSQRWRKRRTLTKALFAFLFAVLGITVLWVSSRLYCTSPLGTLVSGPGYQGIIVSPDNAVGRRWKNAWQPTPDDIRRLEKDLTVYIETQESLNLIFEELPRYRRQYYGCATASNAPCIKVQFAHRAHTSRLYWLRCDILVFGGSANYWNVWYDVHSRSFPHIWINAEM